MINVSLTISLDWVLFFIVWSIWHTYVSNLPIDPALHGKVAAALPPQDPATPFLLAYLRRGLPGAAELAVYSLLIRGIVRFVDGAVDVIRPNETLPTLYEQSALAWAVTHHRMRPDPYTYFQHRDFAPLCSMESILRDRGLRASIRPPAANRRRTHWIALVFLGLGLAAAAWLGPLGASNGAVITLVVSGAPGISGSAARSSRRPTRSMRSYLATSPDPTRVDWVRHTQGALSWHDLMWAGGLYGVPAVWGAKVQVLGQNGQAITPGAQDHWFADTAPREPVRSSSSDAADGSH
ncbi:MAG: hypothetical protein IPO88_27365 [Nannocystis sp.]|uniref:hypothetical protein n=1 Tax=Nannocystis sp. TaxID=1962667 RepID=UPI00242676CA|nr:hypothetical protein [Nannocystis sp.]MBK9757150.1 hypothetical protein [Nannocystis sp.]